MLELGLRRLARGAATRRRILALRDAVLGAPRPCCTAPSRSQGLATSVVEAFQGLEVLKVMSGRVDRSMGDVHPLRTMREQKVRVILHESWYPTDVTNRVAKEAAAKVVVVPQSHGALKGTEDYLAHLDHVIGALASALK